MNFATALARTTVRLQVSKWVETPIQRYLGNRSIISTARSVKDSGRIDAANRERAGTLTPRLQSRTPSVAPLMPRHRYDAPTIWLIVRINP